MKSKQTKTQRQAAVLDLASQAKPAQPVAHEFSPVRKTRSAQSIHGISKRSNPVHASPPAKRSARAATTPKSSRITKFHKPAHTKMSPHRSYALNQTSAKPAAHTTPKPASYIQHQHHHEPAKPKRKGLVSKLRSTLAKRPRLATGIAVTASVLVLGAYITYLNLPNLAVRYAAGRAGVDAQIPRYTPAGYSFVGPTNYGNGQITIQFNSNSDNGFLALTQSNTNWDSDSLRENFVKTKSQLYAENLINGLTVYTYGNGNTNAAWVNNGILYNIEGNTKLGTEQILKIASSL